MIKPAHLHLILLNSIELKAGLTGVVGFCLKPPTLGFNLQPELLYILQAMALGQVFYGVDAW